MTVKVTGVQISDQELKHYIDRAEKMYPGILEAMEVEALNDEDVKITYHFTSTTPFERIRRITGYLVGTLDKWNDAKRAEERDRVKHEVTVCAES